MKASTMHKSQEKGQVSMRLTSEKQIERKRKKSVTNILNKIRTSIPKEISSKHQKNTYWVALVSYFNSSLNITVNALSSYITQIEISFQNLISIRDNYISDEKQSSLINSIDQTYKYLMEAILEEHDCTLDYKVNLIYRQHKLLIEKHHLIALEILSCHKQLQDISYNLVLATEKETQLAQEIKRLSEQIQNHEIGEIKILDLISEQDELCDELEDLKSEKIVLMRKHVELHVIVNDCKSREIEILQQQINPIANVDQQLSNKINSLAKLTQKISQKIQLFLQQIDLLLQIQTFIIQPISKNDHGYISTEILENGLYLTKLLKDFIANLSNNSIAYAASNIKEFISYPLIKKNLFKTQPFNHKILNSFFNTLHQILIVSEKNNSFQIIFPDKLPKLLPSSSTIVSNTYFNSLSGNSPSRQHSASIQ